MSKFDRSDRATKGSGRGMLRRTFIKGGGGLGLVLAAGVAPAFIRNAGASTPRKVSFMLPFVFVGGHGFEFVAKATFWKERGLDVHIVRGYGSGAACKTISAGQVTFGEASYGVMVNGVAGGLDNVGIGAKLQKSPISITCRAETGIKTPKDLEGRTLVNAAASGDTIMFRGFAKAAGFDSSKVNVTNMHPSKLVGTLLNKQSDCSGSYYVSIGAVFSIKAPMVHFMYADYGLDTLDLGLITQRATVENEPKLVQDIVDGAMMGLKVQLLEPAKALDYMIAAKEELKIVNRPILELQMGNTNALSFGPAVEKNGLGWMDPVDQKRTRDLVIQYMNVKNVPPIEKLFTNKFAGNVKLTADEWAKAKSLSAKYMPGKA